MATIKIHDAKTHLSKLIARAEAGEEVVIARGDKPVVKLVPVATPHSKLTFGCMKGKLPKIPDSFFFDPLPDDELKLWEGGDDEGPVR